MHIQEKPAVMQAFSCIYGWSLIRANTGTAYNYLSDVLLTAIVSISTNAPIGSLATW